MKHKTAPLLAAIAAALPLQALALGLGNITLDSALNEPLQARIDLQAVRGTDPEDIRVALAASGDFQRAGLERPFLLSKLRFRVRQDGAGQAYISVTSQQPIREPFLSFLLEVNWPAGRLVREYTVLLDPPIYGASPPATVAAPRAPAAPGRGETAATVAAADPLPPPAAAGYGGGRYGPVQRNETLWSIASQVRPGTQVTVQQMMLAILRANPDAFADGNINGLKAGQILQIPQQAGELDPAEAMAEVRRQHALWDEYRGTVAAAPGRMPAGATPGAGVAPAATAEAEGQLKLLSPGQGERGATGGGDQAALEARVSLLQEEASSAQAENQELRTRLAETEQLLEDFKRLIQLKDENIAALQQRIGIEIADAAPTLEDPAAPAPAPETVPDMGAEAPAEESVDPLAMLEADLEAGLGAGPEDSGSAAPGPAVPEPAAAEAEMPEFELPAIDEAPAPESAAPPAEPAPPPTPARPPLPKPPLPPPPAAAPQGFMDSLPVSPVVLGGGLAAIIALLAGGVLLKRRGKARPEDREGTTPEPEDSREESPAELGDTAQIPASEALAPTAEAEPAAPAQASMTDTLIQEPREDDALDEVNVYLAYERYDQAEQLVRKALEEHPDRHHYYLKLLEIHHAARNPESYERDAAQLRDKVGEDHELMDKARGWWKEFNTGRALFAAGAVAGAATVAAAEATLAGVQASDDTIQMDMEQAAAAGEGLDFDLGLTDDVASSEDAGSAGLDLDLDLGPEDAATAADEGLDLDFDLGEGDLERDELGAAASGSDDGLDFDLDAFDQPAPSETQTLEQAVPEADANDMGLDFDLDRAAPESAGVGRLDSEETEEERTGEGGLDFDLGEQPSGMAVAVDEAAGEPGLDLDLGESQPSASEDALGDALDFDLGEPETGAAALTEEADQALDFELGDREPSGGDEVDSGGLDFDLGAEDVAEPAELEPEPMETPLDADSGEEIDFDLGDGGTAVEAVPEEGEGGDLDFDLDEMERETGGALPLSLEETTSDLDLTGASTSGQAVEETPEEGPEIDFDLDLGFDDDAPEKTLALGHEGGDLDEVGTKLDLAQAYVDMGDAEGARAILSEVMGEGSDAQKAEAQELLNKLG